MHPWGTSSPTTSSLDLALDAGWDKDLLRVEIAELSGEDFELGLLGFDDLELKGLLRDDTVLGEEAEAPIEVPENPTTRSGDLWVLGTHRLLCGDSTDSAAVAALLGTAKPVLMVTDPPYGVE